MFFKKCYWWLMASLSMVTFLTTDFFVIAGCVPQKHNSKIFDQLNNSTITITPNNDQWGCWIKNPDVTDLHPNRKDQLPFLEKYISSFLDLDWHSEQHLPFNWNKKKWQYLNPLRINKVPLISHDNNKKGVLNIKWLYTKDQKKILTVYHKLQKKRLVPITGLKQHFNQTINLWDYQTALLIGIKQQFHLTKPQVQMIQLHIDQALNMHFDHHLFRHVYNIAHYISLVYGRAHYHLNDFILSSAPVRKPLIRVAWTNLDGVAWYLQKQFQTYDWQDPFFTLTVYDVSDKKSFADQYASQILWWISAKGPVDLTPSLYKYFSFSHTKLKLDHQMTPVTLFFNKQYQYKKIGVTFAVQINVTRW